MKLNGKERRIGKGWVWVVEKEEREGDGKGERIHGKGKKGREKAHTSINTLWNFIITSNSLCLFTLF